MLYCHRKDVDYDKNNPEKAPEFESFVNFKGALSKFHIKYDGETNRFYAVINRIIKGVGSQRNILTLTSSENLYDWKIERDLINLEDADFYEDDRQAAISYVNWDFDGEDIILASRTALNGAVNNHDTNMLTFHRFINFRDKENTLMKISLGEKTVQYS